MNPENAAEPAGPDLSGNASSDAELLGRIAELLCECQGFPRERVTPETTLQGDAGMDGDDAREFLAAFASTFDVSLDGLRFADHFSEEGFPVAAGFLLMIAGISTVLWPWCLPGWLAAAWWWQRRCARPRRELTVADLLRSARAGHWVESG
jgi:acyl carrier protein